MNIQKNCIQCEGPIISKSAKKFCTKSCAAKYNNKKRSPRTEESKRKTSTTLKALIKNNKINPRPPKNTVLYAGPHTKIYRRTCTHCKKDFWARKDYTVTCSKECRYHRSAFNNVKKQHIKFYNKYEDKTITLHSNWEVKLAEWLTSNNIKWIRPTKTLRWNDEGKTRIYTPDFVIVDCDLYVDVKNPLKIKQDAKKLAILKERYNLLVGNIEECQQGILAALP